MDIQWYPGHMAKTRRMIKENLHMVDLVVELVDARAPWSTHLPDIKDLIRNKRLVVAINKSDLVHEGDIRSWLEEYTSLGISCIAVSCINRKGLTELKRVLTYASGKDLTRCMVVGVPNVGKSFLINQLAGKKVARTGDRPGVTRGKMWLKTGSNIALLDTPGVLWPKFETRDIGIKLALIGSIKQELLKIEELAHVLIRFLNHRYPDNLSKRYKIDHKLEPQEAILRIAKNRGFLLGKGDYDLDRCANTVINEFKQGKLGRISLEKPNDDPDLWDTLSI